MAISKAKLKSCFFGRRRNVRLAEGGFTILEIIMVVVIIGTLMGFLVGNLFSKGDQALAGINRSKMQQLKAQINLFRIQYSQLPASITSLTACDNVTGSGCTPMASDDDVKDAWGTPFKYELINSSRGYRLTSLGSDKAAGGSGAASDASIEGP
jgi:general secretion pathway protein G